MRKEEQAFTLLEIMLVVTIIALLLAAAIKFMSPNVDIAKRVRVTGDIQAIKTSLLAYQGINGFYPTTEQGLQALVTAPSTDPRPSRWQQFMEQFRPIPGVILTFTSSPGQKNPTRYDLYSGRSGSDPRYRGRRLGTIGLYSSESSSGGGTMGIGTTGVTWISLNDPALMDLARLGGVGRRLLIGGREEPVLAPASV